MKPVLATRDLEGHPDTTKQHEVNESHIDYSTDRAAKAARVLFHTKTEEIMGKRSFSPDKRRRELEKKRKQEAKRQRRQNKDSSGPQEDDTSYLEYLQPGGPMDERYIEKDAEENADDEDEDQDENKA